MARTSWVTFFAVGFTLAALAGAKPGPKPARIRPHRLPTYNAPEAGKLNGNDFADWVTAQVQKGEGQVALAEGTYLVTSGAKDAPAHIHLQNLTNVDIWMDSVNLTMTERVLTAVKIEGCAKTSLIGPSVWWDEPGFSQATITDVRKDAEHYKIDYHPDDGYNSTFLTDKDGNLNVDYTHPKTGRLVAGPGWSTIGGVKPAPAASVSNAFTVSVPAKSLSFAPEKGFKLLARGEFLFCNAITDCNDTSLVDFHLLNCGGFGILSNANRRTVFDSVQVKRAPFPPPGGHELPVRSSSADGIHSTEDFEGPTFDSCYFEALDDDCIAVAGSLRRIAALGPSKNTFWSSGSSSVADTLRFYEPESFKILGIAKITEMADPSGGPQWTRLVTVDRLPNGVTINTPYVNRDRVGSGFKVINTHTNGNRGRGAIIKASNGIIANNLFEGVSYAAIDLGPEFSSWNESDLVSNVTVINNIVKDCNFLDRAAASIMLHGDGDSDVGGNTDVVFANNTVMGTTGANLYIGAASNVSLHGTTFREAYRSNYDLWESWPKSGRSIVTLENVTLSTAGGNCVAGKLPSKITFANLLGSNTGWQDSAIKSC